MLNETIYLEMLNNMQEGIYFVDKDRRQDEIIKRADELMYKSKENGRNRVSTDITNETT